MNRYIATLLLLSLSAFAADSSGTIPELLARDGTRYTNVTVTKIGQGRISFRHDDGMTTLSIYAFDDNNMERLIPGHLTDLKAKQAEADAKERERERIRDTQRRQALEQNPAAAAQAKKEDDVREAAIRYALTHFEAPDLSKVSAIIVEIDHDTPSDEFLKRFAGYKPPLRKMPRSQRRELQEAELSCTVSDLKWVSETEAEIYASRVISNAAVSFRYTMRFTNRGWEVIQYKITGIS
jgi:hypothetical protein